MTRQYDIWKQEEVDLLINQYCPDKKVILELAKRLNRSANSIRGKACAIGLSSPTKKGGSTYRWSKEEREFLLEYAGQMPFKYLAKKFNHEMSKKGYPCRSHNAIKKQLSFLSLSYKVNEGDWYSLASLASLLNCSYNAIYNWTKDTEYQKILKPMPLGTGDTNMGISRKNIATFFKAYPGEVAKHKPDIIWLIDLLSD